MSIDHLGSLKLNYGELSGTHGIDISLTTDSIAICTDQAIVIFSLNIDLEDLRQVAQTNINQKAFFLKDCFCVDAIHKMKNCTSFRDSAERVFSLVGNYDSPPKKRKKVDLSLDFFSNYLYDADMYDLIMNLNPCINSNNEKSISSKRLNGFRYCKWNKTLRTKLASITYENEILVYSWPKSHVFNKYDAVSITEILMEKQHDNIATTRHIDDFSQSLFYDLTPTQIEWSSNFTTAFNRNDDSSSNKFDFELLFITFKSNLLLLFISYECKDEIKLKLVKTIDLSKVLEQKHGKNNFKSYFNNANFKSNSSITCLSFHKVTQNEFALIFGIENGEVIIQKYAIRSMIDSKCDFQDLIFLKPSSEDFFIAPQDQAAKINKVHLKSITSNMTLLVISNYFNMSFIVIDLNNDSIEVKKTMNHVLQNSLQSKIVNIIDSSEQNEIFVFYENNQVEKVKIDIKEQIQKHYCKYLPNHEPIISIFNQLDKDFQTHDLLFLNNGFLIVRVSQFQKAMLFGKREFDFQIDIFCLKNECKSKLESLISQAPISEFQSSNFDIFWFSRFYLLFYENQFLAKLKELNDCWKKKNNKFDSVFVRKLRIMNFVAKEYFENEKNSFKIRAQSQTGSIGTQLHNNGKNKSNVKDESSIEIPKNIITSANYYRSIYRELSLSIITPRFLENIEKSIKKFDACNNLEKAILISQSYYTLRKNASDEARMSVVTNFLRNKLKIMNTSKETDFKQYLDKLSHQKEAGFASDLFFKCDICSKYYDLLGLDFNYVQCELGHKFKRCEKTLFAMVKSTFNECSTCKAAWNLLSNAEIPLLSEFSFFNSNSCPFCN